MFGAIFRRVLFVLLCVLFLSTAAVDSFQLDIVFYLLFVYQTVSQLCSLITALRLHVAIFSIPMT